MLEIKLTRNKLALVDEVDYGLLSLYNWTAKHDKSSDTWYAISTVGDVPGSWRTVYMHALILRIFDGRLVDHVDHNGLNNCRENIRVATRSQNLMNMSKRNNRSSIYKGVVFRAKENKWRVRISKNGMVLHLGMFDSEEAAALAYNDAAKALFGDFALLNTIGTIH